MSAHQQPGEAVLPAHVRDRRETSDRTVVALQPSAAGDRSAFRGRAPMASVADLQLAVVSGAKQDVRRTHRALSRGVADGFYVGVQLRGRGVVEQDGRTAPLSPGDLTVYDAARPYGVLLERDSELLVVMVGRHRLAARVLGVDDLTAVPVSGAQGAGALASDLLRGLDRGGSQQGPEAVHLSDAAVDLVAACLAGSRFSASSGVDGDGVVLVAQRYIEDNLSDPSLCPSDVAAAAHVSLRHLQKLFERRGTTITGWTRERRLEQCWRDLGDPRLVHRPVAAVAASWGLVDAAQFSRAFRARYGTTPRAHRAELTACAG